MLVEEMRNSKSTLTDTPFPVIGAFISRITNTSETAINILTFAKFTQAVINSTLVDI